MCDEMQSVMRLNLITHGRFILVVTAQNAKEWLAWRCWLLRFVRRYVWRWEVRSLPSSDTATPGLEWEKWVIGVAFGHWCGFVNCSAWFALKIVAWFGLQAVGAM